MTARECGRRIVLQNHRGGTKSEGSTGAVAHTRSIPADKTTVEAPGDAPATQGTSQSSPVTHADV